MSNVDTSTFGTDPFPRNRVNQLAVAGFVAGALWILPGLVSLVSRVSGPVLDGVLIVGNVLLLFPVFGLYLLYRDLFPRLGGVSLAVVVLATGSNIVGTAAFVMGAEPLVFLAFPVGVLGELIGFLGFAWMTARASRLPKWTGGLLVLTFPGAAVVGRAAGTVSEFGEYPGAVAVGVILLIVGYLMYDYTS